MANEQPSTPERDLLKLIEEEGKASTVSSSKVKRRVFSLFSLGAIRGRVSFWRHNFLRSLRPKEISIKLVNRLLAILLFFLFIYVIIDIGSSVFNLKEEVEAAFYIDKKPSASYITESVPFKGVDYYLEKADKRDIFNIVRKEIVKIEKEKEKVKMIIEKTKHLKLVGIAWSEDPDAMVEDTRAKRTLFVKENDMINDVRVKEILKDKIILSYEGETVELK
jgi:hypothetical protein